MALPMSAKAYSETGEGNLIHYRILFCRFNFLQLHGYTVYIFLVLENRTVK